MSTALADFGHPVVRARTMPYWCVGSELKDPFGAPVLPKIPSLETCKILCQAGLKGLIEGTSAHDNDLVPWDPGDPDDINRPDSDARKTIDELKKQHDAAGLAFHTMTCDLHSDPRLRNGGLTNPDAATRGLVQKKVRRAVTMGHLLGARKWTHWIAREGYCSPVGPDWLHVYDWLIDGLNDVRSYVKTQGYDSYEGGTEEPKPNEPVSHTYIPTAGHAVGLISALDDPSWWGVNPELRQHEGMTLLDSLSCVAFLVKLKKLSFLHLGNQVRGQYDNDYPPLFGPEGVRETAGIFWLLRILKWRGVVEFDCHMPRSEGDPANPVTCRLNFIKQSVRGLQMALTLADRMADSYGFSGATEPDLMAIADMCQLKMDEIDANMVRQ